jgi:hypothetical protein
MSAGPNPLTLGRVTLDDDGVRRRKLFGLFGSPFDLPWSAIRGWAVGADVIHSRGAPKGQVMQWVVELDHPHGTEVVRVSPTEEAFEQLVAVIAERVPQGRRAPRVGQSYDARLPPAIRWMAGPDHDGD